MDSTENPNPISVIRRTCRKYAREYQCKLQIGMNKAGVVTFEMKGLKTYAKSFK